MILAGYRGVGVVATAGHSYTGRVTPEALANLAHLRRARDLIDREYSSDLDVAGARESRGMSSAHFSRQFRAAYGETPYAYLMTRRIERAKALLRRGDLTVTEVCMNVGCTSLGSFSARFTELVGETPTAYRNRDHAELAAGARLRDPASARGRSGRGHRARSEKRPSRRFRNVTGMTISLARCFLQVTDPDLALEFYRDALGLDVRNDVVKENLRWITVGAADQPDVELVLTNFLNGSPSDADVIAALVAKGAMNGVHFHTDDLEATFARLRATGAEIVQEPTDQPWGARDGAVRDPSGNLVRIDQSPSARS